MSFKPDIEPVPPQGYTPVHGQRTSQLITETRLVPDDFAEGSPTRKYLAPAAVAAETDMPFTPTPYQGLRIPAHFPEPAFHYPGEGNMIAGLAVVHGGPEHYYSEAYDAARLGRPAVRAAEVDITVDYGAEAPTAVAPVVYLPQHRAA